MAFASLALLILTSCAGESYPGMDYDRHVSEDLINTESGITTAQGVPIEVFLSPQRFITTTTRGTGPFVVPDSLDAVTPEDSVRFSNRYTKSVFYTFAFRDTPDDQGALTYLPDYTKYSNDVNDGKVNCLVDAGEKPYGVPSMLDIDNSGRLHMKRAGFRMDTTLYYGERVKDVGYNFFVYYVDDLPLEGKMHRDASGVWYDVELDGTQDIMAGSAPTLNPDVLDTTYTEISRNLTREERNHILNVGNYCDYAALRGIHPYVILNHQLARLRFKAYPADKSCDSVFIESIEIECRNKGQLYVVTPNRTDVGLRMTDEYQWIHLFEKNPTTHPDSMGVAPLILPLDTVNHHVSWQQGMEDVNWLKNPSVTIGADMMVPEDTLYKMRLTYRQILRAIDPETGDNEIRQTTSYFTLPAPQAPVNMKDDKKYWYRPGYVYNVNIGVYGLRPLETSVSTDGWQDGGTIYLGEEDEE